jgi:gluconokinase
MTSQQEGNFEAVIEAREVDGHHLVGVSGCGKSSMGKLLARDLGWARFYEGDDFHSRANKEKMRSGIPLTDADRWPWLAAIGDLIADIARRQTGSRHLEQQVR